ncbi:MAG: hypothetical protein QMD46_01265 [Methanomicrobiales archaeon]|nr:hypothetical protein [Methanomicrobiales archaeon]MDI6875725.1 hypothetical protein [Methanomicrobiales archaeon]
MQPAAVDAYVSEILLDFARRTGLAPPDAHPRRYLWTDAFAVCTLLELFRRTQDAAFGNLALRLVGQVHHTLGRHRDDDPRCGWISGLSGREGELHPTAGGLRIGKPLNERSPGEAPDERREWDRDGQYYHYATKWMHALGRTARVFEDPTYIRWALELARTTHAAFVYAPPAGGRKRMYWKMSIDLTRPLVAAMGQHDPLDGLVTYSELQLAARDVGASPQPALAAEIADMAAICRGMRWETSDPLGIGGLLFDAARIAQVIVAGGFRYGSLLESVAAAASSGLRAFAEGGTLHLPAECRLPFRELGLSIGLKGADLLRQHLVGENRESFPGSLQRRVESLAAYAPLGEAIEQYWMDERNQETAAWIEHRDINAVTLATSLAPQGFLAI